MVLGAEGRDWVEAAAREAGFDLAAFAPVLDPSRDAAAAADDVRFQRWIDSGAAGEMQWLARRNAAGELVRGDLRRSLPWARSVLVCAVNYNVEAPRSLDPAPSGSGWIARYAWSGRGAAMSPADAEEPEPVPMPGSDYHEELLPRLRHVAERMEARFGPPCQTRAYVDTGPILERGYAVRAGVGWIGRNTCVLHPKLGSWLLLGVVVTSLELSEESHPEPFPDRCGTCTRCIEACPTDALHGSGVDGAPRLMDATRCIAYLTIEKKGDLPEELREGMGRHVFGCDVCQEVCPWNRRAPVAKSGMLLPRPELVNPPLGELAALEGPAFNRRFRGSPLERTGRRRLRRNVAVAMGNSGDPAFLEQLERWSADEDPVLAQTAQWALRRLKDACGTQGDQRAQQV